MTDELVPSNDSFSRRRVPAAFQASGWKIFFIVASGLNGLPVFLLGAQLGETLGFVSAVGAVAIGTSILAMLGGANAFAGSRSRMNLAMLSDIVFGRWGARIVKMAIAFSMIGWFGVVVSLIATTASSAVASLWDVHLSTLAISAPIGVAVALTVIRGADGLEGLGKILVPLTSSTMLLSVFASAHRLDEVLVRPGSHAFDFGAGVSAVIGANIVSITVQPDFGRFIRRPLAAATGSAAGFGLIFAAVLLFSSIPSLATHTPDLVSATITLGFGVPALAVLMVSGWSDASSCLYSGALSIANQLPRFSFPKVVIAVTLIGMSLAVTQAGDTFIPFLTALGVLLPPIVIVLIIDIFSRGRQEVENLDPDNSPLLRVAAIFAWAAGGIAGFAAQASALNLTHIPAIDSILVAAVTFLAARAVTRAVDTRRLSGRKMSS